MKLNGWTSFDIANPNTAKKLIIRLNDGRELPGVRLHNDLEFDGFGFSESYDLQLKATHWKYI